jgi:RNA polymerase sigma-70 factor (ECF subfamily)
MTIKEYNACVDGFSDGVYAYALKLLRDSALAEDLVQDVFERLWLKRENVEFEKAKSYLFRSTYNGMIDWSRKEKLRKDYNPVLASIEQDHSEELKTLIDQGLQQLPLIQQQLILLRDYEDYAYSEIAEIAGVTESQVKVYLHRGRAELKSYITEHWVK